MRWKHHKKFYSNLKLDHSSAEFQSKSIARAEALGRFPTPIGEIAEKAFEQLETRLARSAVMYE